MNDYALVLAVNYPGTSWIMNGDDYAGLEWLDESPKPTKAALEKQVPEAKYKLELAAVQENRRQAYVIESDPLAFKYQETELAEDKTAWLAKKAEIQARYPEPEVPVTK